MKSNCENSHHYRFSLRNHPICPCLHIGFLSPLLPVPASGAEPIGGSGGRLHHVLLLLLLVVLVVLIVAVSVTHPAKVFAAG